MLGGLIGGALIGRAVAQHNQPQPMTNAAPAPLTVTTPSGKRIHHLQTGYVAVKRRHRDYRGPDGTGIPAILADLYWTEWMPISAWIIEHPEGLIVIDTGESLRAVNDPTYFNCDPGTNFVYRSLLRFAMQPGDDLVSQMQQLGMRPDDVRWVIQTHLHSDHMGGLVAFDKSEIILSDKDYPTSTGALPCRYEPWLAPTFTRFDTGSLPGFEQIMQVTKAGDVVIVPTPGHSEGHQSVILLDGELSYFFAGDASFTEKQMLAGGTAGIAAQPALMRESLAAIRTFAQSQPTIYLPSHDSDLRMRLQQRRVQL